MSSYLAQEIHIIQIQQPVRVIGQNRVVVVKVDETGQLILETFCIVLDGFLCHDLTHIGLTGGIAYHGGSAAKKGDGAMSCPLHVHHGHDSQEMSCGQAVCSGVKADVKGYFFLSEELSYLLRMGTLLDEAALHEYVINIFCHVLFLLIRNSLCCANPGFFKARVHGFRPIFRAPSTFPMQA